MISKKVLVMILAGGEGKRLHPLTQDRAKPAVPFGGRYRIIDFALSNFINSGFYKIKVLTQYKSESLNSHIARAWHLSPSIGHSIDLVPAQMRIGKDWYKGTADAVYQNINLIHDEKPDIVCIFGGDHIYKMDVRQMIDFHTKKNAQITVETVPFPLKEASSYGIIEIDRDYNITGFKEKPQHPKPMPNKADMALCSMGNYVFNTDVLLKLLADDAKKESSHDFGRDLIPSAVKAYLVKAYDFSKNIIPGEAKGSAGYWRDVGEIDSYWQANMDLVSVTPRLNLYNFEWPIRTFYPPYPPAKFVFADEETKRIGIATDSMVAEGSIISGGQINRTVLFPGVRINSFSTVEDSVLFERVDVGRYARVRRAIIDKDVKIMPNAAIGYDPDKDKKRFTVSENGILVIPKGTVVN